MIDMSMKKGSIGEIGMIIIGVIILAVIMIMHSLPLNDVSVKNGVETILSLEVNDETGKVGPLISSKTGAFTYPEIFACELLEIPGCSHKREEITEVAKAMGASIILYGDEREQIEIGQKATGDIIKVDIPMPNGKTETIGVNVGISGLSPFTGDWIWPLDVPMPEYYYISHCFGEKRTTPKVYTHSGIDLGLPKGSPVYAVDGGKVLYTCEGALEGKKGICHGYGNMAVIKHGDYYARYSHLTDVNVEDGDKVVKGQSIGTVGNTGHSLGNHLDFKVYSFDPGQWGYDANIDPLCMYTQDYLDNIVRLKYAQGDEDCDRARVCSALNTDINSQGIEEDL